MAFRRLVFRLEDYCAPCVIQCFSSAHLTLNQRADKVNVAKLLFLDILTYFRDLHIKYMCTCIVPLVPCTVAVCISSLTIEHRNVSIRFPGKTKVTLKVSSTPEMRRKKWHMDLGARVVFNSAGVWIIGHAFKLKGDLIGNG